MIRIVARSVVQTYQKEEYLRLARELIVQSRKEPGCISYELYEDIHNPNVLTFLEEWEDQTAVDRHNNSTHFQTILPKMQLLCVGSTEITLYRTAHYE